MKTANHTVEKIGGTSMSQYTSVRDNIILKGRSKVDAFNRVFVVSAYRGMTNRLLEHKKNGQPGVYGLFAKSMQSEGWKAAIADLRDEVKRLNAELFSNPKSLEAANHFMAQRIDDAETCLDGLLLLCGHGHFELGSHLETVREMLASLGEAHSAWNTARLLNEDGIPARFVDLTGWQTQRHITLDARIEEAFSDLDLVNEFPIVTGYAHSQTGLMKSFNRGYSEMTFSRIAVLTQAREAIIHKEFHLSSADPSIIGVDNAVPIGRTNYDVADQLANLGMEAIHPRAAKGLRKNDIALVVKNTFEPQHPGTLITTGFTRETPQVEIITGCTDIYAFTLFDQDIAGNFHEYDQDIVETIQQCKAHIVSKGVNANTITHYINANLQTMKRIRILLEKRYPDAEIDQQRVAFVAAIGSNMTIPGIMARATGALSARKINILATGQSMRQVDMNFIVNESDYEATIRSLHQVLVEEDVPRGSISDAA
ncbi:aspartate kinase [Coraliomargarita sp. W4R72]